MDATAADTVLDALVNRLRTDLPTVEVTDGQPVALNSAEVLTIGYSARRVAVEITQEVGDMGDGRHELMSIVCLASSLRGEVDMRRVRREAVAIVDKVKASLAAERTLGGLVERAEIGFGLALDQALAETPSGGRGASATVEFTISAAVY